MKVLFLEHVLHVAKRGEIKEVSSGYATNFLFPKKLAQAYTQDVATNLKNQEKKKEADRRLLLGNKNEILEKIQTHILEFSRPSQGQKMLGSISEKDIAEYIQHKYHFPITKKHIDFAPHHGNFKDFGEYEIYITLGGNVAGKVKIKIIPEK